MTARLRNEASAGLQQVAKDVKATGLAGNTASLALFAYSNAFETVGRGLRNFGLVTLGLSAATIKLAADFEGSMGLVQTQARLSAEEFDALKTTVLEMSVATGRSTEELAEGLFDIFSSVFVNARQATEMLDLFAKAAVAGGTDVRSVARGTIAVLNSFGLSASETSRVLDLQFGLVKLGIGTYEEFASAIGRLTPSAVAAGQSIESMSGVLAFATRGGLSASEAVTSLARAYDLIVRPEVRASLQRALGIDVVDQATGQFKDMDRIITEMATTGGLAKLSKPELKNVFTDIFGRGEIRALRFFNLAIPRFRELQRVVQEVAGPGSAGAMIEAFEEMAKTGRVSLDQLKATFTAIGIQFGTALLPIVRELVGLFGDLFQKFSDLDKGTQTLIARSVVFVGVLSFVSGSILLIIGRILRLISIFRLAGVSIAGVGGAILGVVGGTALLLGVMGNFISKGEGMIGTLSNMAIKIGIVTTAFLALRAVPAILVQIAVGLEAIGVAGLTAGILRVAGALAAIGGAPVIAAIGTVIVGKEVFDSFTESAEDLAESLKITGDQARDLEDAFPLFTWRRFFDVEHDVKQAAEELNDVLARAEDQGIDLATAQRRLNQVWEEAVEALGTEGHEAFVRVLEEAVGIISGPGAAGFAAMGERYTALADAARDAAGAAREHNAELQASIDTMLALAGNFLGVLNAFRDTKDATRAVAEAMKNVEEATADAGKGSVEAKEAQRGLREANLNRLESELALAVAISTFITKQTEAGETTKSVADIVREYGERANLTKGEIRTLINTVTDLINEYDLLPDSKKTRVEAPGAQEVAERLRIIRDLIGQIPRNVRVFLTLTAQGATPSEVGGLLVKHQGGVIPSFQTGGAVPALLEPGEFVFSRDAVRRIGMSNLIGANRGGFGGEAREVHIHIEGQGRRKEAEEIAHEVGWMWRTQGW